MIGVEPTCLTAPDTIKTRVAKLLSYFGINPLDVAGRMKNAYTLRSKLVHGAKMDNNENGLLAFARKHTREILNYARLCLIIFLRVKQSYKKDDLIKLIDCSLVDTMSHIALKELLEIKVKIPIIDPSKNQRIMNKAKINSRIPIIKLRDTDKIWLQHIYDNFFSNKKESYRELRARLNAILPVNFDLALLDRRLTNHNGEWPSLLGVMAIEKSDKIIDECNRIILAVKEILLKEPLIEQITAQDIATIAGMEKERVQLLISLITHYGHFYSSGSLTGNGLGFDTLRLDRDDNIFNFYMNFQDFRSLLNNYFKEEEEGQKIIDKNAALELGSLDNLFPILKPTSRIDIPKPNPYFRSMVDSMNRYLCFVIMPFKKTWSTVVFKECIRPAVESLGLQCVRADNLNGQIIMEDVWVQINQAAIIIVDVTGQNSNVMYELGLAHALGKPVILLTQEIEKIPFDFKHHRHYSYSDKIGGQAFFKKEFKAIIRQLYEREYPEIAKTIFNP